jgi:GTP-binding protein HflX
LTRTRAKNAAGPVKRRKGGASNDAEPHDITRAIVLHPVLREAARRPRGAEALASVGEPVPEEARLDEAVGLAKAIDLDIAQSGVIRLARPRPGTFFGPGKVEELKGIIEAEAVSLVIVDHMLTPVQQRNLERAWNAKVLDRTGLILEIFGARARTKEGRLQVELAHLLYQRSRLVRSWTHLERQRGGYGFLGGPGETQIEADRRMIGERIDSIRGELKSVRRTRGLHRASRRRTPFATIALAGYTNAGKSTLFNILTKSRVPAQDQLFATLDPTMRRLELPGAVAILSDTVGFISDLPTTLIAAFRATLEEVLEADLILHVRDIATPYSQQQKQDVEGVLAELGVDVEGHGGKILEVWNKIDLLGEADRLALESRAARLDPAPVLVSAHSGEGLDELKRRIAEFLGSGDVVRSFEIHSDEGALIHWLYQHGEVRGREDCEDGQTRIEVRLTTANLKKFEDLRAKTLRIAGAGRSQ